MPKINMAGHFGYTVRIDSNCKETIIAWFDEWLTRFADPEYPVQIWVTSPVWNDTRNMTKPDWSCDTRFMGTPLHINTMQFNGRVITGETAYLYLMQHNEHIKRLTEDDDERRGIKRDNV